MATGKESIALIIAMIISGSFSVDTMLPVVPRIHAAFDMARGVTDVLASLAPSWGLVIVDRFNWGIGTSASRVISTAIIRDLYEGSAMARRMSLTLSVFLLEETLVPAMWGLRADEA